MYLNRTAHDLLKTVYHWVTPQEVRNRIWEARRSGLRTTLRVAARTCRALLGRTIAEVRLPHARMFVDIRDEGVGQKIYDRFEYEPNETTLLRRYLRPGACMVDVGANIGYFTLLAAGLVGPTGRVIAIEPEGYNFRLLVRNIRVNRWFNVTPLNLALGTNPGTATIHKSAGNYGDHRLFAAGLSAARVGQQVAIAPLDMVLERAGAPRVEFIKIDVQGYEYHVLQGMRGVLRNNRRLTVLTEFWPHGICEAGGDPDAYLRTYADAGFAAFVLERSGVEREVPITSLPSHVPPFDPREPDGSFLNIVFRRN